MERKRRQEKTIRRKKNKIMMIAIGREIEKKKGGRLFTYYL